MKKSKKSLKKKLWELVSEYVRRSHSDHRGFVQCYTCYQWRYWKEVDAGHGISGRNNAVLFDLDIIRPQCKSCNGPPGNGMQYVFGKRLNQEHGEGWFETKQLESRRTVDLSVSWYEGQIAEFKHKLTLLDKAA